MIARKLHHCQRKARPRATSAVAPPPPPRLLIFPQVHQSVHDVFVYLKTRLGHVHNRREQYVEQEGREHAQTTTFHNRPLRVHPIVESQAYSNAIVEVTNDRDHIRHVKPSQYCPGDGSINGTVRFDKVNKQCIQHCVCQSLTLRSLDGDERGLEGGARHLGRRLCFSHVAKGMRKLREIMQAAEGRYLEVYACELEKFTSAGDM